MFCDGQCKKKNKRCGLMLDVFLKNDMTGEQKVVEKCAIIGIFESLARQEQGQIRIQAAVESSRNENVKCLQKQDNTIATGFLGLLRMAQEAHNDTVEALAVREAKRVEDAEIIEGEVEKDGTV